MKIVIFYLEGQVEVKMEDAYTKLRYTDTRYTYKIQIQDIDTRYSRLPFWGRLHFWFYLHCWVRLRFCPALTK